MHIFDTIDNLRDAISLCLTHSRLLSIGYTRVAELTLTTYAPWSGDRIIAVREDLTFDFIQNIKTRYRCDLPPPLCAGGEIAEELRHTEGTVKSLSRYQTLKPKLPMVSIRYIQTLSPSFDWSRFGGVSFADFPLDIAWVILNLSKCQYVRVSYTPPRYASSSMSASTMSRDALLSAIDTSITDRICWSNRGQGSWAGDRITITTWDKAEKRYERWSDWVDVTRTAWYHHTDSHQCRLA